MRLKDLIAGSPGLDVGLHQPNDGEKLVTNLCFDSRRATQGSVYIAIRGEKSDGHLFVKQAAQSGAIAVVVDRDYHEPIEHLSTVVIRVENTRRALADLASRFYKNPSAEMTCVGVTGTNGKTSITHMVEFLLAEQGLPTAVIGTINHHLGAKIWPTEMTTPDPVLFQSRLREMRDLGAQALAVEVSSHALSQHRVDGIEFDVAVFTNLTRDHLDYHKDMLDYFSAKSRLFHELLRVSQKPKACAVINVDDVWGKKLTQELSSRQRVFTYGSEREAMYRYTVLEQNFSGSKFLLQTPSKSLEVMLPMVGAHNVANATSALAVIDALDLDLIKSAERLINFRGVRGRLEPSGVGNRKSISVFVDYAHTPDALEGVLNSLDVVRQSQRASHQLNPRIITVFGCGGDRDRGKRPLMLKAALPCSDLIFVTSDNPRFENPDTIIDEILAEATPQDRKKILRESDRKKAIVAALTEAQTGDVVLIAGKGHETYQQVRDQKHDFSDFDVVEEYFRT